MRTRDDGPSAVRYPRDDVPTPLQSKTPPFELGRANLVAEGDELAILAYGFPVHNALEARELLRKKGHSVAVYDARFAKPVDLELIREVLATGTPILTVEDHHIAGGFGACVIEACADHRLPTENIHRLGLPDRWIYQGSRKDQQAEAGIDAAGIAATALKILEERVATVTRTRREARARKLSLLR